MKMLIAKAFVAVFMGSISISNLAATRYVEDSWGSDAGPNDCRDRRAPCATIDYALDQAQPNDRIIVGPGSYEPPTTLSYGGNQGIKLTSVAGAAATIIDATALGAAHVVLIGFAPKGVLGQKRRGFTIIADNSVTGPMAWINQSEGARIEGNVFISPVAAVRSAIEVTNSDKVTIRYNDISATDSGSFQYGVRTVFPGPGSGKKWNVSENQLSNIENCMSFEFIVTNHANKIAKNRLVDCQDAGIAVISKDEITEDPSQSSRDRYMDNAIRMVNTGSYVPAMRFEGGNPRIQRNLIDGTRGYVDGIGFVETTRAMVKDNLLLGPVGNASTGTAPYGLYVSGGGDYGSNDSVSISGNTILDYYYGVRTDLAEIGMLKNNNILNISECGFHTGSNTSPPSPLKASGNFWDGGSDPDLTACGFTQTEVTEGDLSFNPSSRQKPIRFKDPFN